MNFWDCHLDCAPRTIARFFDPFEFHLLNHLICLSIEFISCIIASRRWNFTLSTFIFTLTFNFYGGFALKIAAYGPSMMGYYLSILSFCLLIKFLMIPQEKSIYLFRKTAFRSRSSCRSFYTLALFIILFNG